VVFETTYEKPRAILLDELRDLLSGAMLEEGFVKGPVAFVAGSEAAEVVQPGEGALDDPADLAQVAAVVGAAARDERLDAA
jgi:hypothetical protein